MTSYNSFSLFILYSLLLFTILDSTDPTVSCPTHCGGIEIPYPFGVGKGCYLEKWYEITCNTSTSRKLVPYLSISSKEVVDISLPTLSSDYYVDPYASINIKHQITSKGCSSDGEELGSLLDLTGIPFYVSKNNRLVAIGCNNTASLTNVEPSIVGCKTSCSTNYHTRTKDYLALVSCNDASGYTEFCNVHTLDEVACNGIRCCKANMLDNVQQSVGVRIENTTTRGCKVAFLTTTGGFLSNESDPQRIHARRYSTVELGLFIHTPNISFVKSLGCHTREEYVTLPTLRFTNRRNSTKSCVCDYNAYLSYATCLCAPGFKGNPYRLGGCEG